MRKLISDYSGGKIGIKYYLVKPKYSRTSINLIVLLLTIISLLLIFYVLPKGLENSFMLPISVVLVILLPSLILGPILLKYDQNGKLFFNEEQLLLKYSDGRELNIPYNEILKIEYRGNVRKDLISKFPLYKTIKVRLTNSKNENIIFEATNEMFLSTEELNIQRTIEPILTIALEAINPKYGIMMNRKI